MKYVKDYYKWVTKKVYSKSVSRDYDKLMKYMFTKEYEYDNWLDENRKMDALAMREHYFDNLGDVNYEDDDISFIESAPCSWLEMFVAFAKRIEKQIMVDDDIGDRTAQWFWLMMTSLGLSKMTDDRFNERVVDKILHTLAYHEFNEDGTGGGLFVVHDPKHNMKIADLWYQMNYYLVENNY